MHAYLSKLKPRITVLSALLVLGVAVMPSLAQLPAAPFDPAAPDSDVQVVPLANPADGAVQGSQVVFTINPDLLSVYNLLGNYPPAVMTFVNVAGAQLGTAAISANTIIYTAGPNILNVFGSAAADGFAPSGRAQVSYRVALTADTGDQRTVYAEADFSAADFPQAVQMPPVVTDFPFREDGNIVRDDLHDYAAADSFGFIDLDVIFKRNWRNMLAAWNGGVNPGLSTFAGSQLELIEQDGHEFLVTDADGNDAAALFSATLDLVGNNIQVELLDEDGDPLVLASTRQEWADAALATYAVQPFTASYSVQDAMDINQDVVEGNVEFILMRGGSVFQPFIQRVIPNVDGEEVELDLEDLLVDVTDLPEDWEVNLVSVAGVPGLPYPIVSDWDDPAGLGVDAPLGQIDVTANVVTYTHAEANAPFTYFYLRADTEDDLGNPVSSYFVQVRIVVESEDAAMLGDAALDLEFTADPHAAIVNLWFADQVDLAGDLVQQGVLEDGEGAVREASWGFPIRLVGVGAAGLLDPDIFEDDPESISVLSPPEPNAFFGENDQLITTAEGGIVRVAFARLVYTPPRAFTGTDSFVYTITDDTYSADGTLNTAHGTYTVIVPVAEPFDFIVLPEPNDREEEVEAGIASQVLQLPGMRYAIVGSGPTDGTINWQRDDHLQGNFIYTPNAGFVGTDSFTFQQWDGQYWSQPAVFRIVVRDSQDFANMRMPVIQLANALDARATWFQIWIGRNGSAYVNEWVGPDIDLFTQREIPRDEWEPNSPLPGGSYQIWVRPWGRSMGMGQWVPMSEFEIPVQNPGIVTLISPIDGVYVDTQVVRYRWSAERDATWYRLWIGRDGTRMYDNWFMDLGEVATVIRDIPNHQIGSDYQWHVRAWGPDGMAEDWSEAGLFTRIPPVDDDDDDDDNGG